MYYRNWGLDISGHTASLIVCRSVDQGHIGRDIHGGLNQLFEGDIATGRRDGRQLFFKGYFCHW